MLKTYYPALQVAAGVAAGVSNYRNQSKQVAIIRKRQQDNMIGGSYSRSRRTVGRYKKKTIKAAHRRLEASSGHMINRWVFTSRFGVGPGAQGIYKFGSGTNARVQPLHIFDLTNYMPSDPTNNSSYALTNGMYAVTTDNTSGDIAYRKLRSNTISGVTGVPGDCFWEYGYPYVAGNVNLKWVDLKMNLYGSYFCPVKWSIKVIRIHDEVACFGAAGNNTRLKQLVDTLVKPMNYSNILTDTGYQKKSYTVLRQFDYVIEPMSKIDASTIATGDLAPEIAPNFKEVKIFMKVDEWRALDWHDTISTDDLNADRPTTNTMQTQIAELHNTPYPTSRLFLCITCSSPYMETTTDPVSTDLNVKDLARWAASYDICLRRKFVAMAA